VFCKSFKDFGDSAEIADQLVELNFKDYLKMKEYENLSKEEFGKEMFFEGMMNVFSHSLALGSKKEDFNKILELNKKMKKFSLLK